MRCHAFCVPRLPVGEGGPVPWMTAARPNPFTAPRCGAHLDACAPEDAPHRPRRVYCPRKTRASRIGRGPGGSAHPASDQPGLARPLNRCTVSTIAR